ncbi:MAG: TonB family protein, partial [Polyangiaceae bacterium]
QVVFLLALASTPFGSRALLFGASAALHLAVLAAAVRGERHGDDLASGTAAAALEISIDVKLDAPANDVAAAHVHVRSHTHPYPVSPDHDRIDHDPSVQHTPYAPHEHDIRASDENENVERSAAPETMTAAPDAPAMPHFTMTNANAPIANGPVSGDAKGSASAPPADEASAPVAESLVSTRATLASGGLPVYPVEAREQEVEADIAVEIVVSPAGVVTEAKVLSHTGYGLDEAAVAAVRGYRFHPAQRGGHSVAVRMRWDVSFKLR